MRRVRSGSQPAQIRKKTKQNKESTVTRSLSTALEGWGGRGILNVLFDYVFFI